MKKIKKMSYAKTNQTFVFDVIGEQYIRTFEGCESTTSLGESIEEENTTRGERE